MSSTALHLLVALKAILTLDPIYTVPILYKFHSHYATSFLFPLSHVKWTVWIIWTTARAHSFVAFPLL